MSSHFHSRNAQVRGQGLAEYALVLAIIAICAILSLLFLSGTMSAVWSSITN